MRRKRCERVRYVHRMVRDFLSFLCCVRAAGASGYLPIIFSFDEPTSLQQARNGEGQKLIGLSRCSLTFGDTFFNVVQGMNHLQPVLWSATITQLPERLVLARPFASRSRAAVVEVVGQQAGLGRTPSASHKVLAEDGKRVYYISWPADSLSRSSQRTRCVLVVAGGQARWWKLPDPNAAANATIYGDDAILLQTADGRLPDVQPPLKMKTTTSRATQTIRRLSDHPFRSVAEGSPRRAYPLPVQRARLSRCSVSEPEARRNAAVQGHSHAAR